MRSNSRLFGSDKLSRDYVLKDRLYDRDGNEIVVKPGHAVVMGQHVMVQVPIDPYKTEIAYRLPIDCSQAKRLTAEWGGAYKVLFPASNGELKTWDELNEEDVSRDQS